MTPNGHIHIRSSTSLQLLISLAWRSNKCRTSDVDVIIGCHQGEYSSWDNIELWMLMYPLGVIMVIAVHVTTPFVHPFLFGTLTLVLNN